MALQMDQRSLPWEEMRDIVLSLQTDDAGGARTAWQLLRSWDGRLTVDSPAAAVYELFLTEMVRRVVRAKAPKSFAWALGRVDSLLMRSQLLLLPPHRASGPLAAHAAGGLVPRSWPEEMADALAAVGARSGKRQHGDDERAGRGAGAHADAASSARPRARAGSANLQPRPDPVRRRRGHDQSGVGPAARSRWPIATTSRRCAWSSTSAPGTTAAGRCPAARPAIRCRRTTTICSRCGSAARACRSRGRRRKSKKRREQRCVWPR